MNKKIVFIGGIWNEDYEKEIVKKSKGNIQNAANILQSNIITGIDKENGEAITIINEIFIGAYPKLYSEVLIKSGEFNHTKNIKHKDYNVGFLNLPYLKHIFRYYNSKKYIRQVCEEYLGKEIYFIGYSMSESIVKGLLYAKKINSKVKTCLIIPDLPEYMNLGKNNNKVFNFIKNINTKKLYRNIKEIDSFVVLTNQMYSKLKVNKPFTVIEGIASDTFFVEELENVKKDGIKKIVYTGSLDEKYGICDLVDAFCGIKNDCIQLVICGAGDSTSYIIKKAKEDFRIKFLGIVENKIAKKLQREAYILVNPRSEKEEYTKYSFPSKTIEYMLSGRPVIMNKLPGVPPEYDEFIYYVSNSLKETMEKILGFSNEIVDEKGKKAREFVLNKKNKYIQAKKILSLLDQI